MSHKFIGAIVAASLVLTTFGAQASYAGDRSRDKALLGAAALVMLGVAIMDSKKNDRREYETTRPYRPHGSHVKPRPLPHRVNRYSLPSECLRTARTHRGKVGFFGRGCLRNNYHFVNQLPRRCAIKVKTRGKMRHGYSPRCLKKHGYRARRG